jgi:hypothetical protein
VHRRQCSGKGNDGKLNCALECSVFRPALRDGSVYASVELKFFSFAALIAPKRGEGGKKHKERENFNHQ